MDSALTNRIINALLGEPLVNNVFRGTLVEAMLADALDPDWAWCSGKDAWAGFDFVSSTGIGLEVKQSAALQAWHKPGRKISPAIFDIAARKQQWNEEKQQRITQAGRAADIYVFARHPLEDVAKADHRNPLQWEFFAVKSVNLPNQKTISLNRVRKLSRASDIANIRASVQDLF